jgi:Na+-driven multidrug efflux pump
MERQCGVHQCTSLAASFPQTSPSVHRQVWILSSLIIDSLAISGQTLVAVQLGRGDPAGARQVRQPATALDCRGYGQLFLLINRTAVGLSPPNSAAAATRQVTDRLLQMGLVMGMTLAAALTLTGPLWPHLFTQVWAEV